MNKEEKKALRNIISYCIEKEYNEPELITLIRYVVNPVELSETVVTAIAKPLKRRLKNKPLVKQDDVLRLFKPFSILTIRDLCRGTGLPNNVSMRGRISNHLRNLKRDGRIVSEGRGSYSLATEKKQD